MGQPDAGGGRSAGDAQQGHHLFALSLSFRTRLANLSVPSDGGSESYRAMCRYNSGFFYKQKVLEPFDYYWRVEPGIRLFCDVDYDPFLFVSSN